MQMIDGFDIGAIAPTELQNIDDFVIQLPKANVVTVQAGMFTNTGYVVLFRLATSASAAATTLANAQGFLAHGGSTQFRLNPNAQYYLIGLVVNGVAATNAGANDRIYISAQNV